SFAEVARLYVRVKAFFEELMVIKAGVLAGKQYITPGGGVKCTSVEELDSVYRCYFLSEQDGEKTEAKIVAGDQAIAQMFNAKEGTSNKVSNHRWWRLVTAVSNDAYTDASGNRYGCIDLSKTDCEKDSDIPQAGDEIVQFGNRSDRTRQAAMVFSTVDADAPSIKLFTGIDRYSLADRDIISYGYDPVEGRAYFNCYGNAYIGNRDGSAYMRYTPEDGLEVKGKISSKSTIDGKTLDDYFSDKASSTFLVRYSADKADWHPSYVEGDMWMQTSNDGGKTWSEPILISASGYTTNLLHNSKGPFELSVTEDGDHYSLNWDSTVHLEQGKTYTISAKTNAAKFEAKHGPDGDKCVMWIFNNSITPSVWQIVSGTDMATDGSKGHAFVWNHPTGTYFLRVNFYAAGDWWAKEVKIEEGENPSPQWTPNPEEMIGQAGADGRYPVYQWAVNTDPNKAPESGWQGAPMSAKPGEYVWMRSGVVIPPAESPPSWDAPVRLTGDRGESGQSVYSLDLSNEMAGIACDAKGNVTGPYPTAQASVHKGGAVVASGIAYSIAQATGASAAITAGGLVEVTGITSDTATIMVQAKVDGLTLQTSMSLYKVRPGASGSGFSDNMLTGTRDWEGWNYPFSIFKKDGYFQGLDVLNGVPVSGDTYFDLTLAGALNLEPDTVYTFSVWARGEGRFVSYVYSNVSAEVLYIDGKPSGHKQDDTNASHDLTDEWKHYSVIFRTLDRTDLQNKHVIAARIFPGQAKEIWVAGAKVEKGENHTPSWSPHPSEMVGKDGADGEAAVVYALEPSVNNITKDGLGNLSASSVACSVYKTTGASTRELTAEKTLAYLRVPDGASGTLPHASGTSSAIDILPDTESVIFELKDGDTLLDRERIPVLTDASGIEDGGVNVLRNSAFEATRYWGISPKYSHIFTQNGLPVGVSGVRTEVSGLSEDSWIGIYQGCETARDSNGNITREGNKDMVCREGEYLTLSFRYRSMNTDRGVYVAMSVFNDDGDTLEYGNETLSEPTGPEWTAYSKTIRCPAGSETFSLRLCLVRNGVLEIAMPQITRGNRVADWRPSPLDFSYITEALKNTFEVNGGLVLASLIKLGYTDADENFRVMAGLSGIYKSSERGGGLAMWAGGDQIDAADDPTNGATFGVRHDGTAYACKNVMRFEPNQVAVGDGVFLSKDGLRLQVGASMKAHITNKPVSIDLAALQSNVNTARLEKDFVYGLRVSGMFTYIKTAPAKSERVNLGELTEGAVVTLHIQGRMKYSYRKPSNTGSFYPDAGARPISPLAYIRFSSIEEEPAVIAEKADTRKQNGVYTAEYT
ncbi:MAG: hypothetical protein K2H94_03210, partial [Duncaniella sp.]|nr:hypothetical protein [Duncaniella sp.]